ncbi:hypothetical protein JD508_15310 [Aeromonas jandaei]|uniref:hypothetical protein n=1 Tax=Aeromonas jandaei TaxID=650 RepID=UPI00191DA288|nr:hypothetical protein [Aeromonas jandaei]MBL0611607.1 hypothetical protein [Aeromonas jandaei]
MESDNDEVMKSHNELLPFELNMLYVVCRDADIMKIKKSIEMGATYEVKYAIRQLFSSAFSFGDKYTQNICENMLKAISITVNGCLSAEQVLYLSQSIDLLSLMIYDVVDRDVKI